MTRQTVQVVEMARSGDQCVSRQFWLYQSYSLISWGTWFLGVFGFRFWFFFWCFSFLFFSCQPEVFICAGRRVTRQERAWSLEEVTAVLTSPIVQVLTGLCTNNCFVFYSTFNTNLCEISGKAAADMRPRISTIHRTSWTAQNLLDTVIGPELQPREQRRQKSGRI